MGLGRLSESARSQQQCCGANDGRTDIHGLVRMDYAAEDHDHGKEKHHKHEENVSKDPNGGQSSGSESVASRRELDLMRDANISNPPAMAMGLPRHRR
jgi:hypothetical protein